MDILRKVFGKMRPGALFVLGILTYVFRKFMNTRIPSRKFWFSVMCMSLMCAKLVHLYSHLNSLSPVNFVIWGSTFFTQDVMLILMARIIAQQDRWAITKLLASLATFVLSVSLLLMAAFNISFFIATGAEIHWKQAKSFHADAAGMQTLLDGLSGCIISASFILTMSFVATPHAYNAAGAVLASLSAVVSSTMSCFRRHRGDSKDYQQLASDDMPETKGHQDDDEPELTLVGTTNSSAPKAGLSFKRRLGLLIPTILFIILRGVRPNKGSYRYLSWTMPLTPFDIGTSDATALNVANMLGAGPEYLGNNTSLGEPPKFDFLPKDPMPGFSDWYPELSNDTFLHYDPSKDPLRISNLDNDILEPLRELLHDGSVKIKHVILIKLESTRADVFPLVRDSTVMDRITESYHPDPIPDEVMERLANLTRTSEFLSGHSSGFEDDVSVRKARGGIMATNAHTTGTYTLKSLPGTLCGINPLVADFNREYNHHLYQPCLPHIFDVLNTQSEQATELEERAFHLPSFPSFAKSKEEKKEEYLDWPWESLFMQSVTDGYDLQSETTKMLGYKEGKFITKETIKNENATHFPPTQEEVCLYGFPDTELREYLRDAFNDAERDHKRLFLTHLTGTTHEPWGLPYDWEELVGKQYGWGVGVNTKLNRYLNTIGFADRWLAEIVGLLEETGIANETLLIMAGDHGITVPEDAGLSPYDNPHVSAFHVPLLFSHPSLPAMDINKPVILSQVLPTILDLLIETDSLDPASTNATRSLLGMYEGQSLIRSLKQESEDGRQDWQFTVMNTGGTWLAMRSAKHDYRLVVPLIADVEWRFTDTKEDPKEVRPLLAFDPDMLMEIVHITHGNEAAEWVREAAHVSQWFIEENWRKWQWTDGEE